MRVHLDTDVLRLRVLAHEPRPRETADRPPRGVRRRSADEAIARYEFSRGPPTSPSVSPQLRWTPSHARATSKDFAGGVPTLRVEGAV